MDTPRNIKTRGNFVRKKTLQMTLKEVSQQMYMRNKELIETNRTLTLLRTIDALVLEQNASLQTVCEHITAAIAQATDSPFVGLFTLAKHTGTDLNLSGWSGKAWLEGNPPIDSSKFKITLNPRLSDMVEAKQVLSLETADITKLSEITGESEKDLAYFFELVPLKSLNFVRLTVRRHLVGILVTGSYGAAAEVPEADVLLLDRLSESIGVALDNKLLFEENRRVVRQLRESNAKLLALDQTKDDFISMASHQLRTPLTSVKGYLSMVLDGDAGKITKSQEKLLTQSFISSQRMVYLISDLLNLSRLNTGKFIIETKPVNLVEVIQAELDQLRETAKARELTLLFLKPASFPTILLDDTKIHQVVMNFLDNAIYYTPAGGTVEIELHETAGAVECRVKDTGIGVPRAEQPHLFTKFYRADNAKQARPDGTGLGLYMAKKVIVAMGGAIIFESTVGKGSTFGFSFSKAGHMTPTNPDQPAANAPVTKSTKSANKA